MLHPFILLGLVLAVLAGWAIPLQGAAIFWGGALLWLGFSLAAVVLYALALLIASYFVDTEHYPEKNHRGCRAMVAFTMGCICRVLGVQIQVSGLEKLPRGRFLLVANHRSNLDPIVLGWALRKYGVVFVMKQEMVKWPLVGPLVFRGGYIPLDRDNNRAALKAILRAVDVLKKDWCSVGIFPEGTRNKGQGLLEFRNGAFKIAQKSQVPVVVVKLTGTNPLRLPRSTRVQVEVLETLDREYVAGHDTAQIGERVREILLEDRG